MGKAPSPGGAYRPLVTDRPPQFELRYLVLRVRVFRGIPEPVATCQGELERIVQLDMRISHRRCYDRVALGERLGRAPPSPGATYTSSTDA